MVPVLHRKQGCQCCFLALCQCFEMKVRLDVQGLCCDGHCLKGAEHWFAFAHPLIRSGLVSHLVA